MNSFWISEKTEINKSNLPKEFDTEKDLKNKITENKTDSAIEINAK